MAKLGAGLTVGVTAPLTLFGKSAISAASDAVELQSMFDTTFGNMSDNLNKWAETTGDAMYTNYMVKGRNDVSNVHNFYALSKSHNSYHLQTFL